ncbi:hypothetical protein TIFTF001_013865 [Ficus carica]|uniref:Subtilisin-like protease fibronectin type-III domain-containing protein n=1 Tax=Ficus carica TaxID=3494 RepID=A0AA88A2U6_FICCA|nr:hypothetical protein TIFTF001_013865 [Ficus carica]
MDPKQDDDREFAYGSGLLNPVKAVDMGLVFDASEKDYIKFLCKQGYNSTTVRAITDDHSPCRGGKQGRGWDLNYPSFSLTIKDGEKIWGSFKRTVTNFGKPNSTTNAAVAAPESLRVKVELSVLSFEALGEKKSFKLKIDGPNIRQVPIISASITWKDGVHEPDITAPGVGILGAWSPVAAPSLDYTDKRSVSYYINSGTSMAAPHVTGAAAHVKAAHPSWSAAAIKSALMTTANVMDPTMNKLDREFAYGSGLLNPAKAVLPGLVYDETEKDYIGFQCKQGYNTTVRKISRDKSVCRTTTHGRGWDLNYPSLAVAVEDGHEINTSFFRTVTNVGLPNSTYHVRIEKPDFADIKAQPSVLSFNVVGEKKSFIVKVNEPKISQVPILSASVTWEDGVHVVR